PDLLQHLFLHDRAARDPHPGRHRPDFLAPRPREPGGVHRRLLHASRPHRFVLARRRPRLDLPVPARVFDPLGRFTLVLPMLAAVPPPTLTLPRKGGGDKKSSLPPCGGGPGWGAERCLRHPPAGLEADPRECRQGKRSLLSCEPGPGSTPRTKQIRN